MQRRRFLQLSIGGGGALLFGAAGRLGPSPARAVAGDLDRPPLVRDFHAIGTEISIAVLHESQEHAERAAEAAKGEIRRIDAVMSLYQPHSDLVRLNCHGSITAPDPRLIDVLRAAQDMSRRTEGAFDVTVQPLWKLYADAARGARVPTDAEVNALKSRIDWRRVEVQPDRIRLTGRDIALTLNGIAQGYAADRAVATLRRHGIAHALVNAGEVASLGRKANGQPWTAGIQHPRREDAFAAVASLDGRCLATSGDYASPFSKDCRFNHLFDPRSGRSPEHYASVSVVAPTATLADALSTALYVLPPEQAMKLIRSTPRADAMFILKNGRVLVTSGFPS